MSRSTAVGSQVTCRYNTKIKETPTEQEEYGELADVSTHAHYGTLCSALATG